MPETAKRLSGIQFWIPDRTAGFGFGSCVALPPASMQSCPEWRIDQSGRVGIAHQSRQNKQHA